MTPEQLLKFLKLEIIEMNKLLKDLKKLLQDVQLRQSISRQDLWVKLSILGHFTLVQKLRDVELRTAGFSTIIVPPTGFVADAKLNSLILKWLRYKRVNVFDVNKRIIEMQKSLE